MIVVQLASTFQFEMLIAVSQSCSPWSLTSAGASHDPCWHADPMVSVSPYTGEILSSVKLSAPAYLPPIVADNQVYVLTDDGKLTAYR